MKIKCKVYDLLFRAIPIKAWQAFLIGKHFSRCPHCREEIEIDDQIKELVVSLEEAQNLPPLWPPVQWKLQRQEYPSRSFFPRWRWAAAAASMILLLLIFFFPFSSLKKQLEEPEEAQIMVQSVKIGSKAAKYYIFQSEDPDKLIVWTQKK